MEKVNLPSLAQGRKRTGTIDTIVLHSMAQYLDTEPHDQSAYDFLKGQGLSAHALIDPSGCVLVCAGDDELCYHAKGYNTHSLGVEFLVPGLHTYASFIDAIAQPDWLTGAQYQSGIDLCAYWCKKHRLNQGALKMHSSLSPKRKLDPGKGFPIQDFVKSVFEAIR